MCHVDTEESASWLGSLGSRRSPRGHASAQASGSALRVPRRSLEEKVPLGSRCCHWELRVCPEAPGRLLTASAPRRPCLLGYRSRAVGSWGGMLVSGGRAGRTRGGCPAPQWMTGCAAESTTRGPAASCRLGRWVVRAPSFDVRGKAAQRDRGASGGPKGRCRALRAHAGAAAPSLRGGRGGAASRGSAEVPPLLRPWCFGEAPGNLHQRAAEPFRIVFCSVHFSAQLSRGHVTELQCASFPVFPVLPVSFLTGVMW